MILPNAIIENFLSTFQTHQYLNLRYLNFFEEVLIILGTRVLFFIFLFYIIYSIKKNKILKNCGPKTSSNFLESCNSNGWHFVSKGTTKIQISLSTIELLKKKSFTNDWSQLVGARFDEWDRGVDGKRQKIANWRSTCILKIQWLSEFAAFSLQTSYWDKSLRVDLGVTNQEFMCNKLE